MDIILVNNMSKHMGWNMFTFYFIIIVYCMRIEVGDDCAVYKERIANANGNQEELKRVILEIFDWWW